MKNKFKWGGLLVALGSLSLAAAPASASIITTFSFSTPTEGEVAVGASCGDGCYEVQANATVVEGIGLPGPNAWDFSGLMKFYQGDGLGVGIGSAWSFTDSSGDNDLFGSLIATLFGDIGDAVRFGFVTFAIDGGDGIFANAQGGGTSNVTLFDGEGGLTFDLTGGWMNVVTPVPEPGTTGLLLAGLGMMGFMAWRRRRALPQA